MDSYKKLLVLHYFNSVGASYSFQELLMIFGFQSQQLDKLIDELLDERFLKLDGYYKLTEKAISVLEDNNLFDSNFEDIEEEEIFTEIPIGFNEIYIPEKFDKKFK